MDVGENLADNTILSTPSSLASKRKNNDCNLLDSNVIACDVGRGETK